MVRESEAMMLDRLDMDAEPVVFNESDRALWRL